MRRALSFRPPPSHVPPLCISRPPSPQVALAALTTFAAIYAASSLLGLRLGGKRPVWLVDLACFTPPARLRVHRDLIIEAMTARGLFTPENIEFQQKILERSGLGDATGLSDAILRMKDGAIKTTLKDAMDETEMVLYDIVETLLRQTAVDPADIDIVITSCSCFAPTPSMAAMLVNRFKMRRDVLTYSMAGMGCSSSLVCIDLAKHLLQALPNKRVLVVNHENITNNWYVGNDRSMLVVNCLFRLGGAAALMSNRAADAGAAKYELTHTVRTHLGCEDDAFGCMGNGEDKDGVMGVFLRKNVVAVAGRALKANITRLAPLVLPWSELVKCARDKAYAPDFSKAFAHFLLHTGGRGVIDELEAALNLSPALAQPSKDTLERFGNTSAASTWYILANLEHAGSIKKGDKIWQLGFGGGFKCNSAVWKARRNVTQAHDCWQPYE
jgi:3-ketoacyl-CoA synthase